MAVYCPVLKHKVVYLTCQECEDKVCKKNKSLSSSDNDKQQNIKIKTNR